MKTYNREETLSLLKVADNTLNAYVLNGTITKVERGKYGADSVDAFVEKKKQCYNKQEAIERLGVTKFQFADFVETRKIKNIGFNMYLKKDVDDLANDIQERRKMK